MRVLNCSYYEIFQILPYINNINKWLCWFWQALIQGHSPVLKSIDICANARVC